MKGRLTGSIAGVCLLVATAGCSPTGLLGPGNPLPTASATLHWAKVDLPRGSYCWSYPGHAECADSAGPEQLLRSGFLKPYRTAGGFDALITFKAAAEPADFSVNVFAPNGKTKAVPGSARHTFSIETVTPPAAGIYVYVITGKWSEGDVSFLLALDLIPGVA